MLAHLLCDSAQPNTGEIVDGEPRIFGIVEGEHAMTERLHLWIREPLLDRWQAHTLRDFLKHDLNEDTATAGRVILVDFDAIQNGPGYSIVGEQMPKQARDVAQPVCFVPMNGGIVISESRFEALIPDAVEFAETFADEAI